MGTRVPKDIETAQEMADYPPNGLPASIKALPEWIQLGCGDKEYHCKEKGATFLAGSMPDKCPDLSKHSSFFADVMRENPGMYEKLKGKTTKLGVNLGHCIKTGVDNPGHPMIKTVGLVAGDEESYELFAELMDPVISARHNGYAADAKHPTDMNPANLSTTFEERRELERVIVKGLEGLTGDLKGDYFPLHGNRSYAAKPTGMSLEKEEELRSNGNLFQEPDSTLLLSSGCGRHWPDARGIFHNEAQNFFVWVNEEDQMRIVSIQKGASGVEIFNRFSAATEGIQKVLKKEGYDFMHNDHLGWVLTCPSNLGTGLRAGAMVKVPHVSGRADFKQTLAKMGLQARGTGGVDSASTGGTWDISNADRLGKSEIELVNIFIEGVAQIIRWEQALEKGENIEAEIAAAGLPKTVTIEVPFTSTRGMKL